MATITSSGSLKPVHEKDLDHPSSGLVDKRFDLLRSYALTSLFVMLIIGGLSGVLFSSYLANSLLERDAVVSQAFIQSLTEVEGGPDMFRLGESLADHTRHEPVYGLPELVDHIATIPGVIRANLFSDNGLVLWSTQEELIGKRFDDNHDLNEALEGKIYFELKDIKEEQKAEYVEFGSEISRLVENYLPIWDFKAHKVVAVVEIYKAPKTLFDAIRSTSKFLFTKIFIYLLKFSNIMNVVKISILEYIMRFLSSENELRYFLFA